MRKGNRWPADPADYPSVFFYGPPLGGLTGEVPGGQHGRQNGSLKGESSKKKKVSLRTAKEATWTFRLLLTCGGR